MRNETKNDKDIIACLTLHRHCRRRVEEKKIRQKKSGAAHSVVLEEFEKSDRGSVKSNVEECR